MLRRNILRFLQSVGFMWPPLFDLDLYGFGIGAVIDFVPGLHKSDDAVRILLPLRQSAVLCKKLLFFWNTWKPTIMWQYIKLKVFHE